jgi:L-cysteine desulfidase
MNIKKFLHENVIPVTGCTEPASIAYAASIAYHALSGGIPPDYAGISSPVPTNHIISIDVATDRNVFKNTTSAIIPGTAGQKGPAIAASAGIFLNPLDGLDLLSGISPEIRGKSLVLSLSDRTTCRINPEVPLGLSPDIRVEIRAKDGDQVKKSMVHISGKHDYVAEICINDQPVYVSPRSPLENKEEKPPLSVIRLIRIAESMDKSEIDEVYRGIEMNMNLATLGPNHSYGLGLGNHLRTVMRNQKGTLSLMDKVKIAAAVAADARMGGAPYPVMSSAGSGNQGITALIPLGIVG